MITARCPAGTCGVFSCDVRRCRCAALSAPRYSQSTDAVAWRQGVILCKVFAVAPPIRHNVGMAVHFTAHCIGSDLLNTREQFLLARQHAPRVISPHVVGRISNSNDIRLLSI